MRHLDHQLDDLLALRPEDRSIYFKMRSEQEREAIMILWAKSPRLRVTDIVALPQPYQAELISYVVGDPQKGRPGTRPLFEIEPVDGPVQVESGTMNSQRLYYKVEKRTTLPADRAIHAMLCYGPYAEMAAHRGRLREVDPEAADTPAPDSEPKGKARK